MKLESTRQAFGETLLELMETNPRIFALTADVGESLRMMKIKEEMPDRFIDTGVAESNVIGIAAGLSLRNYIPVAGAFACFMTRAYDHIRIQICQNNLHAIIVGSHAGVSNAADGGTANALEDIAYMRALPNMKIVFPADAQEVKEALPILISSDGPFYLRLYREPTPLIENKPAFKLGKGQILKEGENVTIIATGPQAAFALEAAEFLKQKEISAEIISIPTIKPIDADLIIKSAQKTKKVFTVEDHSIFGGLGSAVSEVLSENYPVEVKRIGWTKFGESGKFSDLMKAGNLNSEGIAEIVSQN